MPELIELKIQRLKQELGLRGLNTVGNKSELQARLSKAMETDCIEVDEHDFSPDVEEISTKVEEKNDTTSATSTQKDENSQLVANVDPNALLAAISAQLQVQETRITGYMASQLDAQKGSMASQLQEQETRMTSGVEAKM